jgi:hypothetical protein
MGIPACLWRRTGEIYKGNKEFASLVNVPIETLREVTFEKGIKTEGILTHYGIGSIMHL